MNRLPRWARAFLRLAVPASRLDDVIGDIEETRGGVRDAVLTGVAFIYCRARVLW